MAYTAQCSVCMRLSGLREARCEVQSSTWVQVVSRHLFYFAISLCPVQSRTSVQGAGSFCKCRLPRLVLPLCVTIFYLLLGMDGFYQNLAPSLGALGWNRMLLEEYDSRPGVVVRDNERCGPLSRERASRWPHASAFPALIAIFDSSVHVPKARRRRI